MKLGVLKAYKFRIYLMDSKNSFSSKPSAVCVYVQSTAGGKDGGAGQQ